MGTVVWLSFFRSLELGCELMIFIFLMNIIPVERSSYLNEIWYGYMKIGSKFIFLSGVDYKRILLLSPLKYPFVSPYSSSQFMRHDKPFKTLPSFRYETFFMFWLMVIVDRTQWTAKLIFAFVCIFNVMINLEISLSFALQTL